jgi:hypothetical protein
VAEGQVRLGVQGQEGRPARCLLDRALGLVDRTLADPRWAGPRRREIARVREVVCDYLVGDNVYGSTDA